MGSTTSIPTLCKVIHIKTSCPLGGLESTDVLVRRRSLVRRFAAYPVLRVVFWLGRSSQGGGNREVTVAIQRKENQEQVSISKMEMVVRRLDKLIQNQDRIALHWGVQVCSGGGSVSSDLQTFPLKSPSTQATLNHQISSILT